MAKLFLIFALRPMLEPPIRAVTVISSRISWGNQDNYKSFCYFIDFPLKIVTPSVDYDNEEEHEDEEEVGDTKIKLAERGGFEPPTALGCSRFPGVRVKPLCHLSIQCAG